MPKISAAFQGEAGAYSEAAAYEYFGDQIQSVPCPTFEGVFTSVRDRGSSHGLIPIENSLAGSIHRNYDLLLRHDLPIFGEYFLRVSHCLLALPGVQLEDIRRVYSHPQALAQCEASLSSLGVERVAEYDTAGSARLLRDNQDARSGAIASRRAAEVYGLHVLKDNMEDNPANFTRFLVLSRHNVPQDEINGEDYKTSIVFSLENKPGMLYHALGFFAQRDIDLTKIESRPLAGKPWEYFFYIDFAGQADSKPCAAALDQLKKIAPFLRVLGSYPRDK